MRRSFDPFRLLLISVAGWLGQQQGDSIDRLREENRVLRKQLQDRRLITDAGPVQFATVVGLVAATTVLSFSMAPVKPGADRTSAGIGS
jgi:hypothetical protein